MSTYVFKLNDWFLSAFSFRVKIDLNRIHCKNMVTKPLSMAAKDNEYILVSNGKVFLTPPKVLSQIVFVYIYRVGTMVFCHVWTQGIQRGGRNSSKILLQNFMLHIIRLPALHLVNTALNRSSFNVPSNDTNRDGDDDWRKYFQYDDKIRTECIYNLFGISEESAYKFLWIWGSFWCHQLRVDELASRRNDSALGLTCKQWRRYKNKLPTIFPLVQLLVCMYVGIRCNEIYVRLTSGQRWERSYFCSQLCRWV